MSAYRFEIAESFTPSTMPMCRLAEYMTELASLLGEPKHVHFVGVSEGSVRLLAEVDVHAVPAVRERVEAVRDHAAPEDAMRAAAALDDMLARDNAVGRLSDEQGAEIILFPGKNRPKPNVYGPFIEEGTLEGVIVRVGGRDRTVHVHIQDDTIVHTKCETTRELARRLAPHIYGATVRLHGIGTWKRLGTGSWELLKFRIQDFDVLDDTPLSELVAKLRLVPGNEWDKVNNPVEAIIEDRGGGIN